MYEGIKFFGMDDKKEEQLSNQSHHVKKPEVCNEEVKHQKENHGYFSNLEISCQEQGFCSLDFFEEQNDNYFEMHGKNEVVKSEILNDVVDALVENCYENSLHGYFEDQFDSVQGNV